MLARCGCLEKSKIVLEVTFCSWGQVIYAHRKLFTRCLKLKRKYSEFRADSEFKANNNNFIIVIITIIIVITINIIIIIIIIITIIVIVIITII